VVCGGSVLLGSRKGIPEGTEMEMPIVETPHEAPHLLRNQQCLREQQRRLAVEQQREHLHGRCRLDDGRAQGGSPHQTHSSRLPILEMYAGGGGIDRDSASSPLGRRNAAAVGIPAEGEGVLPYYSWGYGAPGSITGIEQREELGFLDRLRSLRIGDERVLATTTGLKNNPVDPCGIWSRGGDESFEDVLLNRPSLLLRNPVSLSDQEKQVSSSAQLHRHLTSNWLRPCPLPDGLCSESINLLSDDGTWGDLPLQRDIGLGGNRYQAAAQVVDPLFSAETTKAIDELLTSQTKTMGCSEHFDASALPILPQKLLLSPPSGISVLSQQKGLSSNSYNLQSASPVRNAQGIKALGCDDSFIIQGSQLRCLATSNGCGFQRERKRTHTNGRFNSDGPSLTNMDNFLIRGAQYLPILIPKFQSLMDIRGSMFLAAKDQYGCRFLQRKFDEGTVQEREMIFSEIIDHVPELMVNPFGNYLMQKVLDVCTEDERLEIILVLTKDPTELVRISLNMHGTRAVQRLIETLKNNKQIAAVISALQPGFLSLIKDANGNHVIQRCLQYFSYEDSEVYIFVVWTFIKMAFMQFIFEAAARHSVDIARHRHGCCVLQRCIAHSTGQHQVKLLTSVSRNGLILAQDAYG
ncbi:hypothetical protein Taro_010564, partial [Colocasia esculenta]|nr:hypothetical protein [Colocasia esculenta]